MITTMYRSSNLISQVAGDYFPTPPLFRLGARLNFLVIIGGSVLAVVLILFPRMGSRKMR